MARPSLKAEKTEHILQAYERCIGKYGVEGATLQKVAEEADMARPLLRHYVGNQDDLLSQSIDRYFTRQAEMMTGFQDISSADMLLNVLFDADYTDSEKNQSNANDIMIASAFTLAAPHYPNIKKRLNIWFSQHTQDICQLLATLYPNADDQQVQAVSIGVIGIYFNFYAMQPLGIRTSFLQQSRTAAKLLLGSLARAYPQSER